MNSLQYRGLFIVNVLLILSSDCQIEEEGREMSPTNCEKASNRWFHLVQNYYFEYIRLNSWPGLAYTPNRTR
ncbi:hypothetical protein C8R42DRAFT_664096 [Lentinula raphanica]|nr:hypothetical protein C8R42DRAFT_664096 [Lentinula raphanica]